MELHERLALARKQAGFESATDAAEALNVPYPTYAGHENGSSGFRAKAGAKYARRFKVRFEWLMLEQGPMRDGAEEAATDPIVAEFSRYLPKLPASRRQRLYSDLRDALRLEGVEETSPALPDPGVKTGE